MILARRIILFIFTALYLLLCPFLILYSFGYIFNPVEQEITRAGLVFLSTIPSGADIYLGKSRYASKTPASITSLNPGKYRLTVTLKGYKPWGHYAEIKAGESTPFENIILIPEYWTERVIMSQKFLSITPIGDSAALLLSKSGRLGGYALYDLNRNKKVPLLKALGPFRDLPVLSVFSHERYPVFIVYGGTLWNKKCLFADLTGEKARIVNITSLVKGEPYNVVWGIRNYNEIFIANKNGVDKIDVDRMSVTRNLLTNIKGFAVDADTIYSIEKDNSLNILPAGGRKGLDMYGDSAFGQTFFKDSDSWQIKVIKKNVFLFRGKKGELITNLAPYKLANQGVKGFKYYGRSDKLLIWTSKKIEIADFKVYRKDILLKKDVKIETIYDNGKDINECFMTEDSDHLIFKDGDSVCFLEVYRDGGVNMEFLARSQKNSGLYFSEKTGNVYYLEPETGHFKAIQVIPKEELLEQFFDNKR